MTTSQGQVAVRFARMIKNVQPLQTEVSRAVGQISRIRARLLRDFEVSSVTRVGSHTKGTAIRRYSDVDVFVVLRRRAARRGDGYVGSGTLLGWVRDSLRARFPDTETRRDKQAVVVGFGKGRHSVDVVPAIFRGPAPSGGPLFSIPDGHGSWLETSPGLHRTYFGRADSRSGSKLRSTVQLLKWWCRCRTPNVPIGSFFIEMSLAASGVCEGARPYSAILPGAMYTVASDSRGGIDDPVGVSGRVPAADTPAKRERILKTLVASMEHAVKAREAEERGKWSEAVRQWKIVFNGDFPS